MKRDYVWNTIGVLAQNAISPLLLVIITRLNGIYDSGLFSFTFSMAIIFWVISMWGGRTYQVSDVKKEFSDQSYIATRLILGFCVLIGATAFCIINSYDSLKTSMILTLVILKILESIADAIYGILQVNDRLFTVGKSLLYKAVLGFTLFVIVDYLTKSILLASFSIVLANVLLIVTYDLRIVKKRKMIKHSNRTIKGYVADAFNIIKICSPIFAVAFLAAFSLNIPRYFVDMYHPDQNGYFGIIAMPITLVVLIMTFILQPNIVRLSHLLSKKDFQHFSSVVKKLMFITIFCGVVVLAGTYFMGVQVLEFIFAVNFSRYRFDLIIVIIGAIMNAVVAIYMNLFIILRRFKEQFYILLGTNVLLAFVAIFIVRQYSLMGGFALFTVINVIQATSLFIAYKKHIDILEKYEKKD